MSEFYAIYEIEALDLDEARKRAKSLIDARSKAAKPISFAGLTFSNPNSLRKDAEEEAQTLRRALADAERERLALVDAWRAQLEEQGMPKVTAALLVQDVIDRARGAE